MDFIVANRSVKPNVRFWTKADKSSQAKIKLCPL
jgi:hypothetical protein